MYTIKIISYDSSVCTNINIVRNQLSILIEKKLSEQNIESSGLNIFLGDKAFYTLHGFTVNGKTKLTYNNWAHVNESINKALDELNIVAHVRAGNYTIRSAGKDEMKS